jgi:hypothetical protein
MKNVLETTAQNFKQSGRVNHAHATARIHPAPVGFAKEGIPSPRAAVAFSALSTCVWLGETLAGLAERIRFGRAKSQVVGEGDSTVQVVKNVIHSCIALLLLCGLNLRAQPTVSSAPAAPSPAIVPRLMNFSGRTTGAHGRGMTEVLGVTFAIYKDQHEGAPLWSARTLMREPTACLWNSPRQIANKVTTCTLNSMERQRNKALQWPGFLLRSARD